jgi:hypothetical protein
MCASVSDRETESLTRQVPSHHPGQRPQVAKWQQEISNRRECILGHLRGVWVSQGEAEGSSQHKHGVTTAPSPA